MIPFWLAAPLLLAAIPQTLFVLQYAIRPFGAGQWWRDRVGRALFIKGAALAVVLDMFLIRTVIDRPSFSFAAPATGYALTATVAYWLVFVGVTYQYLALVRSRRHPVGRRM